MSELSLSQECPARLIGLDWGTTSLRAYVLGDAGRTLRERSLPLGIMRVEERNEYSAQKSQAFESALEEVCGDWMRESPSLPILAAGMVGSNQGWIETPYLSVPFELAKLCEYLTPVRHRQNRVIHFVPGLLQKIGLPDVMRGEETQILGALPRCDSQEYEQDILFAVPGTHSKWVRASRGFVREFRTFMTGEVFAVLCRHTILGRAMRDGPVDMVSFDRGVRVAANKEGKAGVLSNIFSVRTLGITGELSPEAQTEYLSGVLLGHEISSLSAVLRANRSAGSLPTSIILIGEEQLCARYSRALKLHGYENVRTAVNAMQYGLWKIAAKALLAKTA